MNSFDLRFRAILSGGLGVVAISFGAYVYSDTFEVCGYLFFHPYGNIGMWLMSLGLFGVLFAILSLDSSIQRRKKSGVNTGLAPNMAGKSTFAMVMIGLLVFNLAGIAYFTPTMLSDSGQFFYSCPVEQLSITGATITSSSGAVAFSLYNSGTSDITIASVTVNGGSFTHAAGTLSQGVGGCAVASGLATVPKGSSCTMTATFGTGFVAGTSYAFTLTSSKGDTFPYTTTA